MSATIQKIARSLNLSHTTVSRVLNARPGEAVADSTRERVLEAAQAMGYRPHRVARALVTGRTQQIALWMNSLYTAFHAQVVHGVEQQLRQTPYQLVIASPVAAEGGSLERWQVDGCLVFESEPRIRALLKGKGPVDMPLVSMGGSNFASEAIDYVGLDLRAGTDEALRHLMEIGCRRIAFVGESASETRRTRYSEVLRGQGRKPEFIVTPGQQGAAVREAVRTYIAGHGCPDGLFCFNDEVALGTYRALRDLRLHVPEDAAIVGCDGIEYTEYLDTPLSTIALPVEEMCRLGWEFLQRRIEDPALPRQQVLLRPRLVIRDSSRR